MSGTSMLAELRARAADGRAVGVGLVGTGVFGSRFLAQARRVPGIRMVAVADLMATRAVGALQRAGWTADEVRLDRPIHDTGVLVTDDGMAVCEHPQVDVVVDATGDPLAAIRHALAALDGGRHVVNATVEADALLGPLLTRRALERGLVYSFAYGDQPALICELVDWARINGFEVVCAGKGTKHLPEYHRATPDTIWGRYGIGADVVRAEGYDARMFTSFLDGTKSAVEMAAVANATDLEVPSGGLSFPAAGVAEIPVVCRPASAGGALEGPGMVEVVSSLRPSGEPVPDDLRWGVFVVIAAGNALAGATFRDYGLPTDPEAEHAVLYRPHHLVGSELTTSVVSAAIRREPTGACSTFRADVVAVAKRDLPASMELDGEGGYAVHGRLLPAADAVAGGALPIALARGVRTRRYVSAGEVLRWSDVDDPDDHEIVALRRGLERDHGLSAVDHHAERVGT